jgi:CYTH domain-containing protein
MAIVEKKYILNESIKEQLNLKNIKKENISQFYTSIKLCKEVRFRKVDNSYFKTIRTGSEVRKNIVNKKITKAKYQQAKSKKIGKTLKKVRYSLYLNEQKYAVDRYKNHLKNLYILEVSFENIESAKRFKIPNNMKKYITKDASHDNRYRDKNLALLGNPKKKDYDIYTIFKDLDRGRVTSLKDIIFKEMPVDDSIRVILYKIFVDLNNDKELLILNGDIKTLISFRKNIKKSKVILNEFKYLFDEIAYKKVYQHLCMIDKSIAIDKDVDILKQNMPILEAIFEDKDIIKFIDVMDTKLEYKKTKVIKFFQTREFKIIFDQYKLFLKEKNNIKENVYDSITIEKLAQKLLLRRFRKFKHLSKKYQKCYDLDSYKKIHTSLLKLCYILEEFEIFIDKNRYTLLHKKMMSAKKSILSFIVLSRESLIIKTYIKDTSKTLRTQNSMIEQVKQTRKDLERDLNKKIDKDIKVLKKSNSLFNS